MNFDFQGNLSPYEIIQTDLVTFESVFVNGFAGSNTRKKIFDNYIEYIDAFKKDINSSFYQYIDGSFVTKEVNPRDIDIVTFLEAPIYDREKHKLDKYVGLQLHKEKRLDCYFVKNYPVEHLYYEKITKPDTLEWIHLFSKTRVQRNGQKYPKGIIKLDF